MTREIITMDQLRFQRLENNKADETRRIWEQRCAWYPRQQECHFGRIAQIYLESRQMYGDDKFKIYARRNRLHDDFIFDGKAAEKILEDRKSALHLCLKKCQVSPTTNGEYGRIQPSKLHFC